MKAKKLLCSLLVLLWFMPFLFDQAYAASKNSTCNVYYDPQYPDRTSYVGIAPLTPGSAMSIQISTCERFTFDGWYTKGGTKVTTVPDQATCTVYGHWTPKKQQSSRCVVAYHPNFPDGTKANTTYDPNGFQGGANITAGYKTDPVCQGWIFDGWYTAATGGTKVTEVPQNQSSIDVYGHWIGLTNNINHVDVAIDGKYIDGVCGDSSNTNCTLNISNTEYTLRQGSNKTFSITGWSLGKISKDDFYYTLDGGSPKDLDRYSRAADVIPSGRNKGDYYTTDPMCGFHIPLKVSDLTIGKHDVHVYAVHKEGPSSSQDYLVAKVSFRVVETEKYKCYLDNPVKCSSVVNDFVKNVNCSNINLSGHSSEYVEISGWSMHMDGTKKHFYKINGDQEEYAMTPINRDVALAANSQYKGICDANKIGYFAKVPVANLTKQYNYIDVYGVTNNGEVYRVAHFTFNINTITFHANYPDGTDPQIDCEYLVNADMPKEVVTGSSGSKKFNADGTCKYSFDGWYDAKVGGKKINSVPLAEVGHKTEVYAHWTNISPYFTIEFDYNMPNSGSNIIKKEIMSPMKCYRDVSYKLTPFPTDGVKNGTMVFTGWNTEKDGNGKPYRDGQTILNSVKPGEKGLTLYAVWKQPRAIWLESEGKMVRIITGYVGEYVSLGADPVRSGYIFCGWKHDDESPKFDSIKIPDGDGEYKLEAEWKDAPKIEGFTYKTRNSKYVLTFTNKATNTDVTVSNYSEYLKKLNQPSGIDSFCDYLEFLPVDQKMIDLIKNEKNYSDPNSALNSCFNKIKTENENDIIGDIFDKFAGEATSALGVDNVYDALSTFKTCYDLTNGINDLCSSNCTNETIENFLNVCKSATGLMDLPGFNNYYITFCNLALAAYQMTMSYNTEIIGTDLFAECSGASLEETIVMYMYVYSTIAGDNNIKVVDISDCPGFEDLSEENCSIDFNTAKALLNYAINNPNNIYPHY